MKNNWIKTATFVVASALIMSNTVAWGLTAPNIGYEKLQMDKKAVSSSLQYKDTEILEQGYITDTYTKSKENFIDIKYEESKKEKELTLKLTKNTEVYDQFGKTIAFDDLSEDMAVDLIYAKTTDKNKIVEVYEIHVKKENNGSVDTTDYVVSIETIKDSHYIYVGTAGNINKQKIFIVDNDTKLRNENGNVVGIKDIKTGQTIKIEHSAATTMSIPPQSYAYTVQAVKDKTDEKPTYKEDCEIYDLLTKLFNEYGYEGYMYCIKNHNHDWSLSGWNGGELYNDDWNDMDKDDWEDYEQNNKNNHSYDWDYDDIILNIKSIDTKNSTIEAEAAYAGGQKVTVTVYFTFDTDIENEYGKDIRFGDLSVNTKIKADLEYINGKFYAEDIEVVK